MGAEDQEQAQYERSRPIAVAFRDDAVWVTLADGRVISNPLEWHPWLKAAPAEKLVNIEMDVFSVYWPDLDEGLDIEGMLRGIRSYVPEQVEDRS